MTSPLPAKSTADSAPLMVSVSGLRGLVGASLTPAVATRFAGAFGSWLKQQPNTAASPRVVLGRDSRPSGQWVIDAVAAGLTASGCTVVHVGILTTPGVAVTVTRTGADGGMVVTASHNPIIWNGIKPLTRDGNAPPPDEAAKIIQRFHDNDIDWAGPEHAHTPETDPDAAQRHVDLVLQTVDIERIRNAKLKVVLDSVHGAGGPEGRMLLDALGVEVVHLFAKPTGHFPHTPEPTRENLVSLSDAMREHGGHLGFAQDPDADRLAVVDEQGTYIGEEYTLSLCVKHMLEQAEDSAARPLAANLSTSRMIDDLAATHHTHVLRTPVGEASVAQAIREHHCIAGGEGNGGIIDPRVVGVRDSLVGMALLLELLAKTGQPLSAIVQTIPRYAMVKEKVPVSDALKADLVPKLTEAFATQKLDLQDGVRIDWDNRWVHVRSSNTEPIIRLIAEAESDASARELIDQVRAALNL